MLKFVLLLTAAGIWVALAFLLHHFRAKRMAAKTAPSDLPALRKLYNIYSLPNVKERPSDEELRISRPGPGICIPEACAHPDEPRNVMYSVFGTEVRLQFVTRCPECTQALLETLFERCAACGLGIAPGQHVAIGWIDAPHPYTHVECAETPELMCGMWGWGRLIQLEELGSRFNKGVATVMQDTIIDHERSRESLLEETASEETPPDGTPSSGAN